MNQHGTAPVVSMLTWLWKLSVALVVFLLPTNLFLTLCENCGYTAGLLSDYLIPKLYLQDLVVISALALSAFLGFFSMKRPRTATSLITRTNLVLALIWTLLLLTQLMSANPGLGALHWLRITIFSAFGYLVWSNLGDLRQLVLKSSQLGLLFQAFVAIIQWYSQSSLAGYWLLGEPTLSAYSGITKTVINGAQFILPYGTTPHPNILGGYASIVVVFSVFSLVKNTQKSIHRYHLLDTYFSIASILAGLSVIFLTQSAPAALALILAGLLGGLNWNTPPTWLKKIILKKSLTRQATFIFFLFLWSTIALITWSIGKDQVTNPSLFRRAYLLESSQKIISENVLIGVGLGQFTSATSQEIRPFETSRFNQPVHHVILLWVSETGILGLVFFLVNFWLLLRQESPKTLQKPRSMPLFSQLVILTPLLIWDHYLISLPQGQLLVTIWIASALERSS